MHSLFPNQLLGKAEEEISHHEERGSAGSSQRKPGRYHPYASSAKPSQESDHGSRSNTGSRVRMVLVKPLPINRNRPRGRNIINDNYCFVNVAGKKDSVSDRQVEQCGKDGWREGLFFFLPGRGKTVKIFYL